MQPKGLLCVDIGQCEIVAGNHNFFKETLKTHGRFRWTTVFCRTTRCGGKLCQVYSLRLVNRTLCVIKTDSFALHTPLQGPVYQSII